MTLQAALDTINVIRPGAEDSLLMIKLAANPLLKQSGLNVFKTDIDLLRHDCIHILLGRGLLEFDSAFTAGFALGSSKKVTCSEHGMYAFVARHITPEIYSFSENEMAIFKEGIRLSYISGCSPLDQFNFAEWFDQPLETVRDAAGVETDLLKAYYAVEQRRYPRSAASQRLLLSECKVAAFS
jgi:hypothetical protein